MFDPSLALAGLLVGFLVGLTGMGGGALLTPLLVLVFKVSPLTAISSDLLTSLVMKPVGAAVHARRRTVHWRLTGWLVLGGVPAGFLGAVIVGMLGKGVGVEDRLKVVIGIALVASVLTTLFRQVMDRRARRDNAVDHDVPIDVRPVRTVLIGVVGGLAVGMTSVGAGSLIIAMLLLAYPQLHPSRLVGTDIVQAIPLVAAATLGHLFFGDVQVGLAVALLAGALPGVWLGAVASSAGSGRLIKPVVTAVLLASALALLGVGQAGVLIGTAIAVVVTVALLPRRQQPATPAEPDRRLDPVS
ncbi:sulfite exporter TauE/SafE family protein [Pseudonocardia sp. C8]|uniref:sulfite exporter TauE/SafE family protein n=1 Tax=Pseudonocardia sp. C8 TaxID=2762759 RepID=UPI0016428690|nr:sulfite exporter TauE/SafE family protein [Pseudonocardia sp. C8]MBC3193221.1 sulfite exporter TauE/SafE family protein [Pseudonocardia sp. C8]